MEFDKPHTFSKAEIYWFDDTGRGSCRVPASWQLLYKDGDAVAARRGVFALRRRTGPVQCRDVRAGQDHRPARRSPTPAEFLRRRVGMEIAEVARVAGTQRRVEAREDETGFAQPVDSEPAKPELGGVSP